MELILIATFIGAVLGGLYIILVDSPAEKLFKAAQEERIREIQAEQARRTAAMYERQAHKHVTPRSAPVTTGVTRSSGSTSAKVEVKRRDNSFDIDVDTYTTPTYSSSHSSGGYSHSSGHSHCSSSSSDSSSSSSDSGGGGCD